MSEKNYRIVTAGEIVGYSETEEGALRSARKAAKMSGAHAYVEAWRTIEQIEPPTEKERERMQSRSDAMVRRHGAAGHTSNR